MSRTKSEGVGPECDNLLTAGLTVAQLAKRYHVSPDKVRNWIRKGELRAVNVATRLCGRRPRFIITVDALAEFERGRQAAAPEAREPRRRRRPAHLIDFYPD